MAKDGSGALAEALFSTPLALARVPFLVFNFEFSDALFAENCIVHIDVDCICISYYYLPLDA